MSNGFTFLVKGFGGRCTIFGVKTFMTGYSLSRNRNWIKSQGITGQHYDSSQKAFKNLQGGMVRDYVLLDLKIDFELTEQLLGKFIDHINKNNNHKSGLAIKIEDENYNYDYSFSDARLISFSFNVSEGNLARGSASFLILDNSMEVDNLAYSSSKGGFNFSKKEKELLPYWSLQAEFGDVGDNCLDISFDWSQTYDLKFLLKHHVSTDDDNDAPDPVKILWHLPTAKFSMTMLFSDESVDVDSDGLENQSFIVKYGNTTVLTCTKCYVETYTPIIGDKDGYLGYTISGFVNGEIKKS